MANNFLNKQIMINKTVFITGATAGFGKACAEKFAAHQYNIIITGRRESLLNNLKKILEAKQGIQVLPLCFNVSNNEAVVNAVSNLPPEWKNIDVLINNAGLALGRAVFNEGNVEDWDTMIDTNVKGLLYVSKAIVPLMIARQQGHVINIGSTAGKEVYEKGNVDFATKFAVDAISKAMRIDLLTHGIKVTSIHPGAAETEFSLVRFKGNQVEANKTYEGFTPLLAEDVANIIYYTTTLPAHVCINDLVVTPTAQANAMHIHKQEIV
jgi:3-hydroxy acid dehydrogenase / malonic semialdehyde reductase